MCLPQEAATSCNSSVFFTPAHGNLIKYVLNFEFVIGRQVKDGDRERESETQITGHSALLSHKMQKKMAAEAGNKTTTAQRHEATTQMFLSFSKSKLCYLTGKPQWAKRHLRPPGSHSKELAKTISLKSPAILIWQPDSITRRKNCFSRHQQSSGNYLNCVMIMPHSSGESFTLLLFKHTGALHECCERPSISIQEGERGWEENKFTSAALRLFKCFTYTHTCKTQKGGEFWNPSFWKSELRKKESRFWRWWQMSL